MDIKKFEEAGILRDRISQLKLLKKYLEATLENKPFKVKVEIEVIGENQLSKTPTFSGQEYPWKEDADYILNKIQERISVIELEFKNL